MGQRGTWTTWTDHAAAMFGRPTYEVLNGAQQSSICLTVHAVAFVGQILTWEFPAQGRIMGADYTES